MNSLPSTNGLEGIVKFGSNYIKMHFNYQLKQ